MARPMKANRANVAVTEQALADAAECIAWQHQWERVGPIAKTGRQAEFHVTHRCMRCSSERTLAVDIYGRPLGHGWRYAYSAAFRQVQRAEVRGHQTWRQAQRAQWIKEQRRVEGNVVPFRRKTRGRRRGAGRGGAA